MNPPKPSSAPEPSSAYDEFAPFYNLYWAPGFLDDLAAGLSETVLPLVPPGARVLDLCCGTGQIAAWLVGQGLEVVGLDGSEVMLDYARRAAPEARFVAADARDFHFEEPFDLVLSTFDSLNHLPTLDDLEAAFRSVRRALAPDGVFCFDMNMNEGFAFADDETYASVTDEHVCISESNYDERAKRGVSTITSFLRVGELWRRKSFEIVEYCYPRLEIEARLARADLAPPKIFDAGRDFGMPHGDGRLFFLTRPR